MRLCNARVGETAQTGARGENDAEEHSDTGSDAAPIPIRMTVEDIQLSIGINEEVEINISTSEYFVDAPEGPASIEVECDLGRHDAEIYLTSLRQVDHTSKTARLTLAHCRKKTD